MDTIDPQYIDSIYRTVIIVYTIYILNYGDHHTHELRERKDLRLLDADNLNQVN